MKTLYLRLKLRYLEWKLRRSPPQSFKRARLLLEIQRVRRKLG